MSLVRVTIQKAKQETKVVYFVHEDQAFVVKNLLDEKCALQMNRNESGFLTIETKSAPNAPTYDEPRKNVAATIKPDVKPPVIIMFNAPPKSGKDLACEYLMAQDLRVKYAYFKRQLYISSVKILGIDDVPLWLTHCQDENIKDQPCYRVTYKHPDQEEVILGVSAFTDLTKAIASDLKEQEISEPFGFFKTEYVETYDPEQVKNLISPRDLLIISAEKIIKPIYGADYFALALVEFIAKSLAHDPRRNIFVIPDLGFNSEFLTVLNHFYDQKAMFFLVTLKAKGRDYSNDSRNYVDWDSLKPTFGKEVGRFVADYGEKPVVASFEIANNFDKHFFTHLDLNILKSLKKL